MEIIKDKKDKLLCIIYRDEDWVEGLNFLTPNELFIQVGSWWYQKDKKLAKHKHNFLPRNSEITQEMVYVKSGSMEVEVFDEQMIKVKDFILYEGDTAIMAYGGHGYKILEDNTKIIESKNGPFISVELDKIKYE